MSGKKLSIWLPLLLSVILVIGMVLGYQLNQSTSSGSFLHNGGPSSVQEVIDLINNKYVDAIRPDSFKQAVIEQSLANLDPHSIYIPPKEVKEVNEELMGNFQGIGVEFQIFNDTINVVSVIPNGPAAQAGIMVGDALLKANDSIGLVGNMNPDSIKNKLRGPSGSLVKITLLRNGQFKNITVKRGSILVPSVEVAYMVTSEIGYIKINRFGERTFEEFMQKLESLQKQGMKKLILDLRGNGGGILTEATAIADQFLDDDKLIVYTEGAHSLRTDYRCKRDGIFEKNPLVVLVNETTASASEVLSGALQDWNRATIIGRRTFGKGLVQQQFQLSNGGALRLTVARYYTPLGRNIQKPYNKGKEAYEDELINRFHDGELLKLDSSKLNGPAYKTPNGHLVYGGGGITPDIFVPYDTTLLRSSLNKIFSKNTINWFVYKFYLRNRSYFDNFKTILAFEQAFQLNNAQWSELETYLKSDKLKMPQSDIAKKELALRIKALMARQLFGPAGYYEIMNANDETFEKAVQQMQ
ncbi:MAG: PDZ domain-containing protein [Sphingobacteriales bacterium]|uniref:S41 family peptidase n=1 Tax=Hydrotalea flava TaxID=714549 RepID=UPI00082ADA11|nr:S41 family peptidase [Hydrotalea flava]RTL53268.1 MAG: PDZ domain-containing protein [Sphingobacteriales bacterium]